jgi:hypothetical protein
MTIQMEGIIGPRKYSPSSQRRPRCTLQASLLVGDSVLVSSRRQQTREETHGDSVAILLLGKVGSNVKQILQGRKRLKLCLCGFCLASD